MAIGKLTRSQVVSFGPLFAPAEDALQNAVGIRSTEAHDADAPFANGGRNGGDSIIQTVHVFLDHAQDLAHLLENFQATIQIFFRMGSGVHHPDASLSSRHGGEAEGHGKHALFK